MVMAQSQLYYNHKLTYLFINNMLPTGKKPFSNLRMYTLPENLLLSLPRLTKTQIDTIEKAIFLDSSEKLRLIMILTHQKFTGELSLQPQTEAKKILLQKLNLPFFINSYHHSKKGIIKWLQVSINQATHQFIQKNHRTMSVMEAGLLYNYPSTAILAYAGLIPRQEKFTAKTPADYFFGMVHSRDWLEEERAHYEKIFKNIQQISPTIAKELTQNYEQRKVTH
jgi:hypothetical protein